MKSGTRSHDYCHFCFRDGFFTKPGTTLEEMINRSALFMSEKNRIDEKMAQKIAQKIIPRLKRWQDKPEE
jgi:L-lysine 2,3-aminomutase